MKYHHGAIRCVNDERISVQAWGELDEQGRLVYEHPEDGTVHAEIYGTAHGDIELALTPPQALMLAIALNEAVYDLHRHDGWPHLVPPIRLVPPPSAESGEYSQDPGNNWIKPLPDDHNQGV